MAITNSKSISSGRNQLHVSLLRFVVYVSPSLYKNIQHIFELHLWLTFVSDWTGAGLDISKLDLRNFGPV